MFKKDIFKKLNLLKEEKVESCVKVYNPFSVTCKNGILIVSPFGSHSYSFEVVFDNEEKMADFIDEMKKSDFEQKNYISGQYVYADYANRFYKVSGFINSALIEELTLYIKEKLNG